MELKNTTNLTTAMKFKAGAPAAPPKAPAPAPEQWEVRPGGMLVQKRSSGDAPASPAAPTIRLKVKLGAASHDIYVSSQATFGDVKRAVGERTGLHPMDIKVLYRDKERDSSAFIDVAGVKEGSKVVVVEDLAARAQRAAELRRRQRMERAAVAVAAIGIEVDKLADQVSALEGIVKKGGRVAETDVINLIESLMNELVKLEGVVPDGDTKTQRTMQVKRVQKYVEKLDVIKAKNTAKEEPHKAEYHPVNKPRPKQQAKPIEQQQTQVQYQQHSQQEAQTHFQQQQVAPQMINWEVFDSLFMTSTAVQAAPPAVRPAAAAAGPIMRLEWEMF